MTKDKTLWVLVNGDFSGEAIVGYRLDAIGNPIAEHEHTYQLYVRGQALISGMFPNNMQALKMLANGYPSDDKTYPVPAHVIGRAVALANQIVTQQKIMCFAESITW